MKALLLTLCLALACGAVQANKVFRIVNPDGSVTFTDVPPSSGNATQIEIPPLNTAAPLAPPASTTRTSTPAAEEGYSEIRITSPGNETSFWDTAGNVNVDISLKPTLRSGDKIDLRLNGESIGGGKSTAIALTNVDRGTHSLQALVKNSNGKVVARSKSVVFTVQRGSQLSPQRRPTLF